MRASRTFVIDSKACIHPLETIEPYHSAAMLILRGMKSFVLRGKPRPDAN